MASKRHPAAVRQAIIDELACGEFPIAVQKYVREKTGVKVPIATIKIIKWRKRDVIEVRRVELNDEIQKALPIANIYYRLLERQKMVDEIKKKGLFYLDKDGIEKNHCLAVNKLLDSAAEDLKPIINVNVNAEINNILNTSAEEFEKFLVKG